VALEQVHLTLSFLGELEDATTNRLVAELKSIKTRRFDLNFDKTGCFPNRQRPRVLWIGLKPEPHLNKLADKIVYSVTSCGIPQEERPFSPHITLARLRQSADIQTFLGQRTDQIPGFPVHEFILFQSCLTAKGAVHTPLKKFDLLSNK
jgi:2'-5' RNA ligase